MGPKKWNMGTLIEDGDHLTIDTLLQNNGQSFRTNVLTNQSVSRIKRHVAQSFGLGIVSHFEAKRVICIQHYGISRGFYDHPFNSSQLLQGVDSSQPQMIRGDVEASCDITGLITKTAS